MNKRLELKHMVPVVQDDGGIPPGFQSNKDQKICSRRPQDMFQEDVMVPFVQDGGGIPPSSQSNKDQKICSGCKS